ncbi:TetR/AcrR family transcriptional regulator [Arenibacterium sp. CAU 1754]
MSSDLPDTRHRILTAALDLLENAPGSGVRMSDIAKRAGVSRQAVYLHFPTRADLLVAATRHVDEIMNIDACMDVSRAATTGVGRLQAFVEAWANYIPHIHGVARALLAMKDTDEAAATAWNDRMQAVREGCAAAVAALIRDEQLTPAFAEREATDVLWMLLSVRNWEHLTQDCGWSQEQYVQATKTLALRALLSSDEPA